jgi:hypothetical protein
MRYIFLFILVGLTLAYFDFDVREFVHSEQVQQTAATIQSTVESVFEQIDRIRGVEATSSASLDESYARETSTTTVSQ